MTVSAQSIDFCINIISTQVAEAISIDKSISLKEAVKLFISSKTHALLMDNESFLYLENTKYVLDMLRAEENGNWDEWLEI
jgi:hypothetical protein